MTPCRRAVAVADIVAAARHYHGLAEARRDSAIEFSRSGTESQAPTALPSSGSAVHQWHPMLAEAVHLGGASDAARTGSAGGVGAACFDLEGRRLAVAHADGREITLLALTVAPPSQAVDGKGGSGASAISNLRNGAIRMAWRPVAVLQRGLTVARIVALSFGDIDSRNSGTSCWLAAASERGTVHIFHAPAAPSGPALPSIHAVPCLQPVARVRMPVPPAIPLAVGPTTSGPGGLAGAVVSAAAEVRAFNAACAGALQGLFARRGFVPAACRAGFIAAAGLLAGVTADGQLRVWQVGVTHEPRTAAEAPAHGLGLARAVAPPQLAPSSSPKPTPAPPLASTAEGPCAALGGAADAGGHDADADATGLQHTDGAQNATAAAEPPSPADSVSAAAAAATAAMQHAWSALTSPGAHPGVTSNSPSVSTADALPTAEEGGFDLRLLSAADLAAAPNEVLPQLLQRGCRRHVPDSDGLLAATDARPGLPAQLAMLAGLLKDAGTADHTHWMSYAQLADLGEPPRDSLVVLHASRAGAADGPGSAVEAAAGQQAAAWRLLLQPPVGPQSATAQGPIQSAALSPDGAEAAGSATAAALPARAQAPIAGHARVSAPSRSVAAASRAAHRAQQDEAAWPPPEVPSKAPTGMAQPATATEPAAAPRHLVPSAISAGASSPASPFSPDASWVAVDPVDAVPADREGGHAERDPADGAGGELQGALGQACDDQPSLLRRWSRLRGDAAHTGSGVSPGGEHAVPAELPGHTVARAPSANPRTAAGATLPKTVGPSAPPADVVQALGGDCRAGAGSGGGPAAKGGADAGRYWNEDGDTDGHAEAARWSAPGAYMHAPPGWEARRSRRHSSGSESRVVEPAPGSAAAAAGGAGSAAVASSNYLLAAVPHLEQATQDRREGMAKRGRRRGGDA
jgi:hypothetical protein